MKADFPAMEGTPFPEVKLAELPEEAKVEIVFPVEVTTYTLEGGKIKKVESAGETKEGVEGQVAEVTPYMKEQWAAGNGGFGAIYGRVRKDGCRRRWRTRPLPGRRIMPRPRQAEEPAGRRQRTQAPSRRPRRGPATARRASE